MLSKGEEKCDAGIAEALHEIGSTHHILADFGTAIPYLKVILSMCAYEKVWRCVSAR